MVARFCDDGACRLMHGHEGSHVGYSGSTWETPSTDVLSVGTTTCGARRVGGAGVHVCRRLRGHEGHHQSLTAAWSDSGPDAPPRDGEPGAPGVEVWVRPGDTFVTSHERLCERWLQRVQRVTVDSDAGRARINVWYRSVLAGGATSLDTVSGQCAFEQEWQRRTRGEVWNRKVEGRAELDALLAELRIDEALLDAPKSIEDEREDSRIAPRRAAEREELGEEPPPELSCDTCGRRLSLSMVGGSLRCAVCRGEDVL